MIKQWPKTILLCSMLLLYIIFMDNHNHRNHPDGDYDQQQEKNPNTRACADYNGKIAQSPVQNDDYDDDGDGDHLWWQIVVVVLLACFILIDLVYSQQA